MKTNKRRQSLNLGVAFFFIYDIIDSTKLLKGLGFMKVGVRSFSLNKRISARTKGRVTRSIKRKVVPAYGKYGMIKNPKRALYNKVYQRTTVSPFSLAGLLMLPCAVLCLIGWLCFYITWYPIKWSFLAWYYIFKWIFKLCKKRKVAV